MAEATARWCGSICGPFSDTLHLLSLLQVKARADGNLTEQPAVGTQKWELELTEESLHKLDLSRKSLSPDLGLSSLLPPHPFHACLPWGPQSSVLLLLVTVETPASSTREGATISNPRSFPCPSDSTLSLQQDTLSLGLRGLGWEGCLGQSQDWAFSPFIAKDANPPVIVI